MSDDPRIPNRHANAPSYLVRRFKIYAGTLQPGLSTLVKRMVWDGSSKDPDPRYTTLDSDNLTFTIWSTFNRSFGQIGEQGWAIFYADSGRWEVISMEASLQRHARPAADVAKGATGAFTIYYANDAGTETSTGISVDVRCLTSAVIAGDDHFIWYEPASKRWYLIGGAGEGDVLVTIDKESPGNNPGDLIEPNGSGAFKGFFTTFDPTSSLTDDTNYVNGTPCWVAVVNKTTGAVSTHGQLPVHERYLGHLNGSKTIAGDARPLVLIHREENYCYNVTIGAAPIASLGTETFTLPDGRIITAVNWSGSVAAANDKVVVLHVWPNGTWIFIDPSPGSDSGAVVTVVSANANGSCLWPGSVAVPNATATYCTDQFPNGGDCWLVVLNENLGSTSSLMPTLTVGQHYIGRHVGDFDNGDTTFTPIYAIRIEENEIYHYKILTPGNIADGGISSVTLLDGRIVTVNNKTGVMLLTDDEVEVYHDLEADEWYFIKSGGKSRWHRVAAVLNADLYPADATATVVGIATFDGSPAPVITHPGNALLRLAGGISEYVILEWWPSFGGWDDDAAWVVFEVQGKIRRRVKGALDNNLLTTDANAAINPFAVDTFDSSAVPTITTAANILKYSGSSGDVVILEEVTSVSPGTWFVACIQEHPTSGIFRGTLGGTLSYATASIGINGVTGCTTADNPMHYAGKNGWAVLVSKVKTTITNNWEIIGVQQDLFQVATLVEFNGIEEILSTRDVVGMTNTEPVESIVWVGEVCEDPTVPAADLFNPPSDPFGGFSINVQPYTFGGF